MPGKAYLCLHTRGGIHPARADGYCGEQVLLNQFGAVYSIL